LTEAAAGPCPQRPLLAPEPRNGQEQGRDAKSDTPSVRKADSLLPGETIFSELRDISI
jgi:hypothetical protein